jgi:hypothetical protein
MDADDPSRMQYELDWNGSFESERTRRAIGSTTSLAGCGRRIFHTVLPRFREKAAAEIRDAMSTRTLRPAVDLLLGPFALNTF